MGNYAFQAFGPGTPDNTMAELNAHPDIYVAAVINVTWEQLEHTEGTFDFSSIEAAIASTVENTFLAGVVATGLL